MKILFICPLWGSEELPFDVFVKNVVDAGYDGVETSLPYSKNGLKYLSNTLKNAGLVFIGQHWETVTINLEKHKAEYRERLQNLATGNPIFINSQTGRDIFPFEHNMEIIKVASDFTSRTGIQITHETHRGKFSFAAHITEQYLEANHSLRICADFSHWCNVSESMLDEQGKALNLAINRSDHIHARVGFPEGPQITDPRAIEWEDILNKHLTWWDRIIIRAHAEGKKQFTITPEFGPYPYMTLLPHTKTPIANQWEINVFMMSMLKKRYENLPS
jgi:sugar phosphate isomerase/epimerase